MMKLAMQASMRVSEYDEAMSDKLPVVSNVLDYDEAKAGGARTLSWYHLRHPRRVCVK